jgi:hypothetical protein
VGGGKLSCPKVTGGLMIQEPPTAIISLNYSELAKTKSSGVAISLYNILKTHRVLLFGIRIIVGILRIVNWLGLHSKPQLENINSGGMVCYKKT